MIISTPRIWFGINTLFFDADQLIKWGLNYIKINYSSQSISSAWFLLTDTNGLQTRNYHLWNWIKSLTVGMMARVTLRISKIDHHHLTNSITGEKRPPEHMDKGINRSFLVFKIVILSLKVFVVLGAFPISPLNSFSPFVLISLRGEGRK